MIRSGYDSMKKTKKVKIGGGQKWGAQMCVSISWQSV